MFSGNAKKSKMPTKRPISLYKSSMAATLLPDVNIMKLKISLALNRIALQCSHLYWRKIMLLLYK